MARPTCRTYGARFILAVNPALTRWANLFRAYGAAARKTINKYQFDSFKPRLLHCRLFRGAGGSPGKLDDSKIRNALFRRFDDRVIVAIDRPAVGSPQAVTAERIAGSHLISRRVLEMKALRILMAL
jgi:hypothetical protein